MKKHQGRIPLILLCLTITFIFGVVFLAQETYADLPSSTEWYMAGANAQRTSFVTSDTNNTTEIPGSLGPVWYRPLRSFVPARVQPVVSNDKVFVSSANGLYAFDVADGDLDQQGWVFATDLPLGHSPTIYNNTVYVGGMDRNLYALPANPSGLQTDPVTQYRKNVPVKTFTAPDEGIDLAAGFETNPLVVGDYVIAGNRNGYLYALYNMDYADASKRLTVAWKFNAGAPIRYSAAYNNNKVYFASMDGYAYAVYLTTQGPNIAGTQAWKSAKLPGAGFYSFWPVVYNNYVFFSGSHHYLYDHGTSEFPQFGGAPDTYEHLENIDLLDPAIGASVGEYHGPQITPAAGWPGGSVSVRADKSINYLEKYPDRRRFFVLNESNGVETNFDLDSDGTRDYPPFLWYGTHSGTRYPPVIDANTDTIYAGSIYTQGDYISQGDAVGWKFNTPNIRLLFQNPINIDEPLQWSMGGNMLYEAEFYGDVGGSINTSTNAHYDYYSFNSPNNLKDDIAPNHSVQNLKKNREYDNLVLSPPVPYKGKLFVLDDSGLIAFSTTANPVRTPLAVAEILAATPVSRTLSTNQLTARLEAEILKFNADNDVNGTLDHLRPGFHSNGLGDESGDSPTRNPVAAMAQYFHNPSDTFIAMLYALPHLTPATQTKVLNFLASEYANYNPCDYSHIGWKNGAKREAYDQMKEYDTLFASFDKRAGEYQSYWNLPPQAFYALWKYSLKVGNPAGILNHNAGLGVCKDKLETSLPSDAFLQEFPYVLNDYLNGYLGYINLSNAAGFSIPSNVTSNYNHLLSLRTTNFTTDAPDWPPPPIGQGMYKTILSSSRNFIDLTKELADIMGNYNQTLMNNAIAGYEDSVPYWFVSKFEGTSGEGLLQQLFDYQALFQAKAWVANQPRSELVKYLDVPAFQRGDLYYIENLVAAIEASAPAEIPTGPTFGTISIAGLTPVPKYDKFEIKFSLTNLAATNLYYPYSASTPTGIPAGAGITVNMNLTDPDGVHITIPCFYYQPVEQVGTGDTADLLPSSTEPADWRCRYAPDKTGIWTYNVTATDSGGSNQSNSATFSTIASSNKGFIKVSSTDSRFFEFSNGTTFSAPLVNEGDGTPFSTLNKINTNIPLLGNNKVSFLRWFPNNEGHNIISPYGGNMNVNWSFGSAGTVTDGVEAGKLYSFKPYFYSNQTVPTVGSSSYRLTFRALVTGQKTFHPEIVSKNTDNTVNTIGTLSITANGSWTAYTLNVTAPANSKLFEVWLHDGLTENDNSSGTIRLNTIELKRDLGGGNWSPNLLTKGDPDSHKYVDQKEAAKIDRIFELAEEYGVYQKLPIFHKGDYVFNNMAANGTISPTETRDNFYSGNGQASRWLQEAYMRYFIARWSYSTSLHSVEQANELDDYPLAINSSLAYTDYIKAITPRPLLVSNSFYGWMQQDYWSNPANHSDYADKHWYTNPEGDQPEELVSHLDYQDSAAYERNCVKSFKSFAGTYNYSKPIVRGEGGVGATVDTGPQHSAIAYDITGTYYRKKIWAHLGTLGYSCDGEWYPRFFDNDGLPFPNASYDTFKFYKGYAAFMSGEKLSNGSFVEIATDLGADGINTNDITISEFTGVIRAFGAKSNTTGRILLWVDNANDIWYRRAYNLAVNPSSATLTIPGLPANTVYTVETYNTVTGLLASTQSKTTNGSGQLILNNLGSITTDLAVKAYHTSETNPTVTPSITPVQPVSPTPTRTPTPTPSRTPSPVLTSTPSVTVTPIPSMITPVPRNITITITDKNNNPIPGVQVKILSKTYTTLSNGKVNVLLPDGTHQLELIIRGTTVYKSISVQNGISQVTVKLDVSGGIAANTNDWFNTLVNYLRTGSIGLLIRLIQTGRI